jgi:hypothetical protein
MNVQDEQSENGVTFPTQPSAHVAFRIFFVKETTLMREKAVDIAAQRM